MNVRVSAREIAAYFHVEPDIVSFIPELLSDFDELGSFPETIVALLKELSLPEDTRVLDLGSGLGAVSRAIAGKLGFRVTGVDMLQPFVAESERRAEAAGLGGLCRFHCDRIRDFLEGEHGFDVVLLISVGEALGPMDFTVGRLREAVRAGGYMVIDDGYALDELPERLPGYEYVESRERLMARLTAHGDEVVREVTVGADEVREQNRIYTERIAGRVRRLSRAHPEHRDAFERYLEQERKESRLIEEHMVCATWLLRKN